MELRPNIWSYLKLCLPYVTVLHLGKEKSSVFLRLYLPVSQLKRLEMYDGTKLVLTLYINMAMSWSLRLHNVGSLAFSEL